MHARPPDYNVTFLFKQFFKQLLKLKQIFKQLLKLKQIFKQNEIASLRLKNKTKTLASSPMTMTTRGDAA
jgi:hypothetical protein